MQSIIDVAKFNASIAPLQEAFRILGERGMPNTSMAAKRGAAYIEETWVQYASGQPIPGASRTVDNREYRNAITRRSLGSFNHVVFVDNDAAGDEVEEDRPRVDLKDHLPFKKSRFSQDGHPYSFIPFRHKTADIKAAATGAGQPGVAERIFKMEKSYVTGSYIDARSVKRFTYKWAAKDKGLEKTLRAFRKKEGGKSPMGRLAGIVRFQTSTGKANSSSYMTFRTISTESPAGSWVIPARAGVPLSKIVFEQTRQPVVDMILDGVKQDLSVL